MPAAFYVHMTSSPHPNLTANAELKDGYALSIKAIAQKDIFVLLVVEMLGGLSNFQKMLKGMAYIADKRSFISQGLSGDLKLAQSISA